MKRQKVKHILKIKIDKRKDFPLRSCSPLGMVSLPWQGERREKQQRWCVPVQPGYEGWRLVQAGLLPEIRIDAAKRDL